MTNADIMPPANCKTMIDVRKGVDATDVELVTLLSRRFGYMDAAARIKQERGTVRDEARKAQVIENVRAEAENQGIPAELIAKLWDQLVEGSIAHEFNQWDRIRS